ncbi:hypothetical protein PHIN9_03070 [Polynucleobacter sp. HIN9]|nr:hypothetical protein PHIN9_03070 [Polynucleobacter sp. HIN9]
MPIHTFFGNFIEAGYITDKTKNKLAIIKGQYLIVGLPCMVSIRPIIKKTAAKRKPNARLEFLSSFFSIFVSLVFIIQVLNQYRYILAIIYIYYL